MTQLNLKLILTKKLFEHLRRIRNRRLVNLLRLLAYRADGRPRWLLAPAIGIRAFPAEDILFKLDLDKTTLEIEGHRVQRSETTADLESLLDYYRERYPSSNTQGIVNDRCLHVADQIVNHIFQWGPYEKVDYGEQIDWDMNPWEDMEWVVSLHRFHWTQYLMDAYCLSRDERYAQAFVELTQDWIAKNPLSQFRHGCAWLDIQTGTRASNLCRAFRVFVHAEAFTPQFLGKFLATLYDHQIKIETIPMGRIHNKAIMELRGFVEIAHTFQEFRDANRWMKVALTRTQENLFAQTTSEGVQREWCAGYHLCVLRDVTEIIQRMESMQFCVPIDLIQDVHKMYEYVFAIATPDLGFPMFGDCSRPTLKMHDYMFEAVESCSNSPIPRDYSSPSVENEPRSKWPLYWPLLHASELLEDSKFAALAKLKHEFLPKVCSYAFPEAGMYVMRNQWGPKQIYLAIHCPPPSIQSGHDHPDNGTFELYAYGRWLMPDTGFYIYGDTRPQRLRHRQTRVPQTLTVGGIDSRVAPLQQLWKNSSEFDALSIENQSYPELMHRRTIWFVNKKFFVFLDEAIGSSEDSIELHFQLAPGDFNVDPHGKWITTAFDDANVLVWAEPDARVVMKDEEGWFSWKYGCRERRKAFHFRHEVSAPAAFLTVVVPYSGMVRPNVSTTVSGSHFEVDANRTGFEVEVFGQRWQIGRDLQCQTLSCHREL